MSVRSDLRDWLGDAPDQPRACAVCGGDWSGVWIGVTEIHVCARCATEILPRLIADARWRPLTTLADVEVVSAQVQAEFWRAVAINALKRYPR